MGQACSSHGCPKDTELGLFGALCMFDVSIGLGWMYMTREEAVTIFKHVKICTKCRERVSRLGREKYSELRREQRELKDMIS